MSLDTNKIHLFILTPCYDAKLFCNYVASLLKTKTLLEKVGIRVSFEFMKNESLITRGRNNMIARAMSDPTVTHIMFIDSDITWRDNDVLKLITSDKDVVGGIYPLKRYNWSQIQNTETILKRHEMAHNKHVSETEFIQQNLLKYNYNMVESSGIHNNLIEIYTLATGFMMIKRDVIERMFVAFPQTKYSDDCGYLSEHENKNAYALFDCGIVNNHYFSEDWMFCHRWKQIGGKIHADITIDLVHTGTEDFKGRFLSSLDIIRPVAKSEEKTS
jgi:hypothetical protein